MRRGAVGLAVRRAGAQRKLSVAAASTRQAVTAAPATNSYFAPTLARNDGRVATFSRPSAGRARNWDSRVHNAEQMARSAGFRDMRERILAAASVETGESVLDLGSGTGLLALAAAPLADTVWALDSSRAMCEYLAIKARSARLSNVEVVRASAVNLPLVDDCIDVVVSNYCLHELSHPDKLLALAEVARVLRPGGRLVVGDMMFSLDLRTARDRHLVAGKVRTIARRGIPGLWRLAKNAARLAAGRWEHPADLAWWRLALLDAGFVDVEVTSTTHEGGIARAVAPTASRPPAGQVVPRTVAA